ncbi:hypothetical protein D9756_005776 [Leucocoprinus leucothites]|uniref:Uncharacterized protein n=1 Tax=Leucocoprinus leucothites TaxID=201217 RepID=A0A8H5FYV0_9AGAR|nr:hypothetical protein D9756_005776 [Leucoagaricus leucothites]
MIRHQQDLPESAYIIPPPRRRPRARFPTSPPPPPTMTTTPLAYASISQALIENGGKSFEEVRLDDYIQSYTRTGRAPQPVAQVPASDKERAVLGLPLLFKPISEYDPILAGRPKETSNGGLPPTSIPNGRKPNPGDIPQTQDFKGERVAGEMFYTICCSEPYTSFSPEELRYYAYQRGQKQPPSDDLQSITTKPEFAQHSFEELRMVYLLSGQELTSAEIIAATGTTRTLFS